MAVVGAQRRFLLCIVVYCALQVDAQILHKRVLTDSAVDTNVDTAVQSEAVTHPGVEQSSASSTAGDAIKLMQADAEQAVTPAYCGPDVVCGYQAYEDYGGVHVTEGLPFYPYCPFGCRDGYDCVRVGNPNMRQKIYRHQCKPHGWVQPTVPSLSQSTTEMPVSKRSGSIIDEL